MVYTCYEMIRDCRADRPAGWSFFVSQYVPAIQRILTHYAPESAADRALLERIVVALRRPDSKLWTSLEPAPERWFVAELRQQIVAELPVAAAEIELDLHTAADALAPLTVTEKLAAWLE